ncbi:uncharacterized protein LOC143231551 isoform X2 [Tachypleus tridentatus]|uniref:uncharacterized protein LOC143231551 isoform X2 n=1 Tax=Tachypleus tridentatus TaxID=6853 RepID=UPI003FD1507F
MKPLYLLVLSLLWAVFCVRGSQNAQLLTKCSSSNIFEIVPPEYKKSVALSTGVAHPDDEARLHWTNEDGSPRKDTDAVSLLSTIKLPQFHLSAVNTTEHTINWDTAKPC